MKSEQEMQSAARPPWRSAWEKLATALAVISLVDLSGQVIKWAALIHWIVEGYVVVRNWLFGWLPFHVPPEWRNYIVLFFVLFSVTNVGFYKRIGRTYVTQLILMLFRNADPPFEASTREERVVLGVSAAIFLIAGVVLLFVMVVELVWGDLPGRFDRQTLDRMGIGAFVVCMAVATGIPIAWRWLLFTAAVFAALIAVNEVYVRWLEPFAHH